MTVCEGCDSEAEYRIEYPWADPHEDLCGPCLNNVVSNFVREFRLNLDAPDETELSLTRLNDDE